LPPLGRSPPFPHRPWAPAAPESAQSALWCSRAPPGSGRLKMFPAGLLPVTQGGKGNFCSPGPISKTPCKEIKACPPMPVARSPSGLPFFPARDPWAKSRSPDFSGRRDRLKRAPEKKKPICHGPLCGPRGCARFVRLLPFELLLPPFPSDPGSRKTGPNTLGLGLFSTENGSAVPVPPLYPSSEKSG